MTSIATHRSEKEQAALLRQWLTSISTPDRIDPVARRLYVIAKNTTRP